MYNKKTDIYVTRPFLPDKDKYLEYVSRIFESNHLTNHGPLVQELKIKLENYLGVKNLLLVSNGTLALQIAYKLLDLKGEVITTPFSFVATTSSLAWGNLTPKFADIDIESFNIDPSNIESSITDNTSAIVPVHVFGNSCNVERIKEIAKKYNLKVIYDAAHSFGVKYEEESILNYGDISILSFHATKIFHSIEGGALIIPDTNLYNRAKKLIDFGINGPEKIEDIGINAKMNEFQAAMGLCVLEEINDISFKRKKIYEKYKKDLSTITSIKYQNINVKSSLNYGYFPIVLKNESVLLNLLEKFNLNSIYPRRYFYPSLNKLSYLKYEKMLNSEYISERILCLPLYDTLTEYEQDKIISILKEVLK